LRNNYIVGDHPPFRLSKDNCQKLLAALVACGGRINDTDNFSFDRTTGKLYEGITLGRADALFSISIPAGREEIFDYWMGENIRELPPEIFLN
jgi:hypothetical protein